MIAITGEDVPVHVEPKSSSPVMETLSYDIVKEGPQGFRQLSPEEVEGETYPWRQIVTPSGTLGYVYGKNVRHWFDHTACFSKIDGKWELYSLSYGDP